MKKTTKAVLLSALVFPGAGHLFLKRYLPGLALAGVSLAGVGYTLCRTVEISSQVFAGMQNGAVPPDVAAITAMLASQATGPGVLLLNIATVVPAICWFIGIVDVYRLGRRQDRDERAPMAK